MLVQSPRCCSTVRPSVRDALRHAPACPGCPQGCPGLPNVPGYSRDVPVLPCSPGCPCVPNVPGYFPRCPGSRRFRGRRLPARSRPRPRIRFHRFVTAHLLRFSHSTPPKNPHIPPFKLLQPGFNFFSGSDQFLHLKNAQAAGREARAVLNLLRGNGHRGLPVGMCCCGYQGYVKTGTK